MTDQSKTTICCWVNGKERDVDANASVEQLLRDLAVSSGAVVVELNRQILAKERYANTPIKEGDRLEIVHFVGGGAI